MRAPFMLVLVLALAGSSRAALPEASSAYEELEDPKCARGECRPPTRRAIDEDDPKLALGLQRAPHAAPRLQLSYRFLMLSDPYGGSLPFHLVELTGFPLSRYFRLGLSVSAGGAPRYGAWLLDVGLSVGVQYPARVTPFLDVKFAGGVIGAEIVDRKVVSYQYRPTIEAGIEVYLTGRMHLSFAVGWAHPVYGGVDARAVEAAIKAGQSPRFEIQDFAFDTVTVRAGIGL